MANDKDHSALITEMIAAQATQHEKIDNIEVACKDIKKCLLGNGKVGLVVRTDRLEQKDAFKTRLFWVTTSGIVFLIIKSVGIDLVGAILRVAN